MENKKENIEIIETSVPAEKQDNQGNAFEKIGGSFKKLNSDKIKNHALFKRGGYSLVITALVLAGLIVFNWLVSSLADRFHLEYDMTADKKNSMSRANLEYIESVDQEVTVTVCTPEGQYTDIMIYIMQNYYGWPKEQLPTYTEIEYLNQTATFLEKYGEYNDKIKVKFVDPGSQEFTAISTKYMDQEFFYGDMIVTSTVDGNERIEVLTFDEIYVLEQNPQTYGYVISANALETALTSAIAAVTSSDDKSAAILTGHSNNNYVAAYVQLLERNNYEVTEIPDALVTSLSDEYDIIVICAPTSDFTKAELDVISAFLDNNGKLGKGLVYFGDASTPYLKDFSAWLKQWGIEVSDGILFGTNANDHYPNSPTTLATFPVSLSDDDITKNILERYCISEYNVPMKVVDAANYERKATALMQTTNSVVIAPIGSSSTWDDYTKDDKQMFDCVIQSKETDFDSENNEISSYVMAFSSARLIQSAWSSYGNLCNQEIVMTSTQRAAHVEDINMFFTEKVITDEFFADKVTEEDTKIVNTIFMFVVPFGVITVGIVIFVRRRNAR